MDSEGTGMDTSIWVICLATVLFFALIIHLAIKPKYTAKIIAAGLVITGVGGMLLYGYGYSVIVDSLPIAVIRTLFSVCGMFAGGDDFSEFEDIAFFQEPVIKVVMWALHLIAFYMTASAVVGALGARVLRRLRLWMARWSDLYLIYGVNDNSLGLGKDLFEQRKGALVYVDEKTKEDETIIQFGGVFCGDENAVSPDKKFLYSIGVRPGKRRLVILALHKETGNNLKFAMKMLKALEATGIRPEQTSLTLPGAEEALGSFLQVKKPEIDSDGRVIHNGRYGYGYVTVYSESAMAARLLVQQYPPCDALTFDEDGCATEDFDALIVGFGQVGQEVLKSLVMNGQFTGSTFHAAVFDPLCERIRGKIEYNSREMLRRYDIQFFESDGRSRDLYDYINNRKHSLKYVVVCAGKDQLNVEIAEEISLFLRRLNCPASLYQCTHQGIYHWSADGTCWEHHGLYTTEVLCTDRLDRMAIVLNHSYCGNDKTPEENWMECNYFNRMSSRAAADFFPALLRASGKMAEEVKAGKWDLAPTMLENLAKAEHLRWNAFHFAIGFETMSGEEYEERSAMYRKEVAEKGKSRIRIGKNMMERHHACLISWEELDMLSARENAVTGGKVDYQKLDIQNVLALPELLRAAERE